MAIVMDYIAKCGCRIRVDDSAYANQPPEIAATRAQELYRKKGYPDDWIALRARGIATRAELTNEWKNRGIDESSDYAILTAEISKAAFGMTPSEYKRLKGLKSENLRDHMTTLELLFTELSEAATTEIARNDDAQGMVENTDAARRGGKCAIRGWSPPLRAENRILKREEPC